MYSANFTVTVFSLMESFLRALLQLLNSLSLVFSRTISPNSPRYPPELICQISKQSSVWELVLVTDNEQMTVHQYGENLEMSNGQCRLPSFSQSLAIEDGEGRNYEVAMFSENKPLIFKFRSNRTDEGWKVDEISYGSFLVIVPIDWQRTGHPSTESELCTDEHFKAHYFYRDKHCPDVSDGFRECGDLTGEGAIKVTGQNICDNSPHGELFVGEVPELTISENVVSLRVGHEGESDWKGSNFEREGFSLSDALENRQGWFFVRAYDFHQMLDSVDFRYFRDLQEIRVDGNRFEQDMCLFPSANGYSQTRIEFINTDSETILPVLRNATDQISVENNCLIVEPNQVADKIECTLESDAGSVDIELQLPRVWWRKVTVDSEFGEWCDKPFSMTRQEFRESAKADAEVQIKLPETWSRINVGFDDNQEQEYRQTKDAGFCRVPLFHFTDRKQIKKPSYNGAVFNFECQQKTVTVIEISPDPIPTIKQFKAEHQIIEPGQHTVLEWVTRNADSNEITVKLNGESVDACGQQKVTPTETTVYKLELIASDEVLTSEAVKVKLKRPKTPTNLGGQRNQAPVPGLKPKEPKPTKFRPELICQRSKRLPVWEIVLVADNEQVMVHQGGEMLEISNGQCRLPSFNQSLAIEDGEGGNYEVAMFSENEPLIFKFRSNRTDEGRRVGKISYGLFLVIVPINWQRTGHTPFESQFCTDKHFKAHYFYRDKDHPDVCGGFRECGNLTGESAIKLTGETICDNSPHGELFVGEVPKLTISENVVSLRVGYEGKSDWKGSNFEREGFSLSDALENRQGWFFVRAYDFHQMLDSVDFRYFRDLQEIRVDGNRFEQDMCLFPSANGYSQTRIEFINTDSETILPVLRNATDQISVENNCLIVEPNQVADKIECTLESDAGSVDIELQLPRVWWRKVTVDSEFGEWCDKPFSMTRQEFRESAKADAEVQIKLPETWSRINVGFDDNQEQEYRQTKDAGFCRVPLFHFTDRKQIKKPSYNGAVFNFECQQKTVTVIEISPDPIPTIKQFKAEHQIIEPGQHTVLEWVTRNADSNEIAVKLNGENVDACGQQKVTPTETTVYKLELIASDEVLSKASVELQVLKIKMMKKALVLSTLKGWRLGKGFSLGEINKAGFSPEEIYRQKIPVDRRRKSIHPINIKQLKKLVDVDEFK